MESHESGPSGSQRFELAPGKTLPVPLLDLIARLTEPLGHTTSMQLVDQARVARVVSASSTNIDLLPGSLSPVRLPDGPTPGRALVMRGGVIQSEVMLWVNGGQLVALEQPWYSDDMPTAWPSAAEINLEG